MRLGTEVASFDRAASLLEHFTGVRVAKATERRRTEEAGAALVALQAAEVERLERETPGGPAGPELLQVSVDGAMVPLLHGVWAEVKTVALGAVTTVVTKKGERVAHAVDLSYFSRLADHETFRRQAWGELWRRGVERAERVVGVVDGSGWCQGFLDYHRADAVRVLDFPHAVEHVAEAAGAAFGPGSVAAQEWLARQRRELKRGDPAEVLAALCLLPVGEARQPEQAAQTQEGTLTYLASRWEQIQYAALVAQGYPIGSGMVESANKLVVEARLKGSGMHWAREQVNPMVALRAAVCSERWGEVWPLIARQLREQAKERAAQRRQERRARAELRAGPEPETAPATSPLCPAMLAEPAGAVSAGEGPASVALSASAPSRRPTMVNGRPTSEHPWKRPLFSQRKAS